MDAIQQIGAVAGLASFLGLALLAFLYFAQARHVRDLEDKAAFIPDELDLPAEEPVALGAAAAVTEEQEAASQAGTAEAPAVSGAEAKQARRVEEARAKAERRARFEQRRGTPAPRRGSAPPPLERRGRPEPRAILAIGLGVVVLVVGVVFAAGKLVGGDDGSSSSSGVSSAQESSGPPTEVAVLNGTPVPGLAAKVGQEVRNANYKLGPVTNTETPFELTVVMYDQGENIDAQAVASNLSIAKVEAMSSDIRKIAAGAPVAVVVGEDRAGT